MNSTLVSQYADIAQTITPFIVFIGIIISMWLSVKALREVQKDRKLRQIPHLAFDYGGSNHLIEFIKIGRKVGGIDPKYAEKVFSDFPKEADSVGLKSGQKYGHLRNYGVGTALSTEVTWMPNKVQIGTEKYVIEEDKLLEPRYCNELNCIPSSPSHILPQQEAVFYRLPTFIQKDWEKKIKEIEGVLKIECKDIFDTNHVTYQEFRIFPEYLVEKPYITITFGDITKKP